MENDNFEEEDGFDGIRKMLTDMHSRRSRVDQVIKEEQDKTEKEILMGLWRDLGNDCESYIDTFHAASAYQEIIVTMRVELHKLPVNVIAILAEAIKRQLTNDVEAITKLRESLNSNE